MAFFSRIFREKHANANASASASANSNGNAEVAGNKDLPRKINIGCGYDKKPGYLNIDSDPACSPDILTVDNNLYDLPRGYFEEVYAKDVLEHIPRAYMMGALFDWASLLQRGGEAFIQTSWIYGIIDIMRAAGNFETIHNWKICLFGNQVHPGDYHHNGFTEETLRVYLRSVGLQDSGFMISDGWLISTRAKKVEDWDSLLAIPDHAVFFAEAFRQLLGREAPPDFVETLPKTEALSRDRYNDLRTIVCSAERLYKIGRELEAK